MESRMISMRWWRVLVFSVIFLSAASTAMAFDYLGSDEYYMTISGDPIKISAGEKGTLAVEVNDMQQYYHGDNCGSVLVVNYENTFLEQRFVSPYFEDPEDSSSSVFTPVSMNKVSDYEINAVFDAGVSGLRVSQNIVYVDGERYYKKIWSISNEGIETYSDLRFSHGGDNEFAGEDRNTGHYDDNLKMVYLTNSDASIDGIMGFYADSSSPSSHYQEGFIGDVWDNMFDGLLTDTVNPEDHDAAYALQWNRASLAPGETWTITAYEKWTEEDVDGGSSGCNTGGVVPFALMLLAPVIFFTRKR